MIAVHLLIIVAFSWFFRSREGHLKKIFWSALIFRITCAIAVGLLYRFYYQDGDTYFYFQDGATLAQLARSDFSGYLLFLWSDQPTPGLMAALIYDDARALFFAKFVSVLNLITADNYWIMAVYFSMMSFAGSWFLFKKLSLYFPSRTLPAAFAFLFFPSAVFWTSGLIKESIACGALFFLTGLFLTAWFEKKLGGWFSLAGLVALWILWGLKYYYAAIFIPVVFTSLVYRFIAAPLIKNARPWKEVVLWLSIFIVPLILVSFMHPNFYPGRFLDVMVSNNRAYEQFSDPADMIHFHSLEPSATSILRNSPLAFISGLYRPFIFEAGNTFQWLAAIENLMLVVVTLFAMKNLFATKNNPDLVLTLAVFVYVFLLCIFITLSTPNFGTLSRYRAGYIPYFLFILLCNNPLMDFLERKPGHLVR